MQIFGFIWAQSTIYYCYKMFNSRSLSFNNGCKMIRAQNMGSGEKNIFGDLIT